MPTWIDGLLAALIAGLMWFIRRTLKINDEKHGLAEKRYSDMTAILTKLEAGYVQMHQAFTDHEKHDDERFTRVDKSMDRLEQALIVIHSDIKEILKRV